jgi:uncharacterized protein
MAEDPDDASMVGTYVGEYRLLRALGKGASGAVYLAEKGTLSTLFALKLLHQHHLGHSAAEDCFNKEIDRLLALDSSYVVRVLDKGLHADKSYYVMEYVNGESLADVLAKGLTRPQLFNYMAQVLCGLRAIHRQGLIHRALKPKNVRLTSDGRAKIADFGFARYQGDSLASPCCRAAAVVADLEYDDPLILATHRHDQTSDLYSFGKMLQEGMGKVVQPLPGPELEGLEQLVVKATSLNQVERLPSATVFFDAMRAVSDVSFAVGEDADVLKLIAIPELMDFRPVKAMARIPELGDVPFTRRVGRLVDTRTFQRLRNVSQLGLVGLVYPGGVHTRFEHSLGTYAIAVKALKHLVCLDSFRRAVDRHDIEVMLATALLHDIGYYPYAHTIEEMGLRDIAVTHEEHGASLVEEEDEIADALREDWQIDPKEVGDLLVKPFSPKPAMRIARSLIKGPVSCDVLDYLRRDSLHVGVPYGLHFDLDRLLESLILNEHSGAIAISEKGRGPLECLLFARHMMFSIVYWHHTVRAATAMLQRAIYDSSTPGRACLIEATTLTDKTFISCLAGVANVPESTRDLLGWLGLTEDGANRQIFKRLRTYSNWDGDDRCREIYQSIARRSYPDVSRLANLLKVKIRYHTGIDVRPHHLLIDAPFAEKDPQINIDVFYRREGKYRQISQAAPAMAQLNQNFEAAAKRVRLICHPDLVPILKNQDLDFLMGMAISEWFDG